MSLFFVNCEGTVLFSVKCGLDTPPPFTTFCSQFVFTSECILVFLLIFFYLQIADSLEMMLLSILAPTIRCIWHLPSWKEALVTTVRFTNKCCLETTIWMHFEVCDCIV